MSQYATIQEFNIYLSDNLKNIKLNEYFNLIQYQFYPELDISFMDYFLELIPKKDEICIEHQKLIEYGIINTKRSNDIKDCLEKFNAQENIDFECLTAEGSAVKRTGRGGANGNKKEYKLTPKLFKQCLMRSIKENKYANYYLLLEECFYYFQEYQIMYQQILLSGKDKKLDEMKQTIDKQSAQIDELLGYAKKTVEQNEELKETVDDMNETVEDMKDNMEDMKDNLDDIKDAFKETADRSVPSPKKSDERHEFILLQHKELINKFKFIRGIQKYNESKITKTYSEYNIIKREFNANPIQLFKQFKETIKEEYKLEKSKITANKTLKNKNQLKKNVEKIKFTNNDLELQFNFTLDDLLNKFIEVANKKYEEYENTCNDSDSS
jgi:uncharacterized protein YoxC